MGSDIRSHHDLKVWQLGMQLAEQVYAVTKSFPKEETLWSHKPIEACRFLNTRQYRRRQRKGFDQGVSSSYSDCRRSLCEVETFLQLSLRLGYGNPNEISHLINVLAEEGRMLNGLRNSLRRNLNNS
jgi:four helix bundle protein